MSGTLSADRLKGTWSLVSWTVGHGDGRPPTEPYGRSPVGLLSYAPDGFVHVNIASRRHMRSVAGERPAPSSAGPVDSVRPVDSGADRGCFSYAGPFVVRGGSVVHRIQVASDPSMAGTDQTREVDLDGDSLILSVDTVARSGVIQTHRLEWLRIQPGDTFLQKGGTDEP